MLATLLLILFGHILFNSFPFFILQRVVMLSWSNFKPIEQLGVAEILDFARFDCIMTPKIVLDNYNNLILSEPLQLRHGFLEVGYSG